MKPIYIVTLMFVFILAGCSSDNTKPEAEVEDRSMESDSSSIANESSDDGPNIETGAIDEYTLSPEEELDNPDSHLSVRIIYFAYDSSEIRPEFRPAIEAHADFLARHPDRIVTLEGHTDERGSREYNLALGERRANAVKRQLTLLGASAGQIRTVSYGEERPEVDGHDESAWSQNRRVLIHYY